MSVTMFTEPDCPWCGRVKRFFENNPSYGPVLVESAGCLPTKERFAEFADLQFQDDRLPLVYVDGQHQNLDDLLARVIRWEKEGA
ncbi:MAG: hypothetical protein LIQ30_06840 [Planctomycetes bacterium]|nr:hypothetical protein [Planctomycetota bacterium]MCD7897472.1 hypothetical protein [Planctomycetaceae bacterium]